MSQKAHQLAQARYFHVYNKSISGFQIFRAPANASRFIQTLSYYRAPHTQMSFSQAIRTNTYQPTSALTHVNNSLHILAYCIMPTHYHLLVNVDGAQTLSQFISVVENSYTRYLNRKTNRLGPLWQSRFKKRVIESNSELLHVTRYIHLNPTSAGLVDNPKDWIYSSYRDYTSMESEFQLPPEISIRKKPAYQRFCISNLTYQQHLQRIKKSLK